VLVVGYIGITYVGYKAEVPVLKQALGRAHLLQSGLVAVVDDKTVRHLPGCPLMGRMGIGIWTFSTTDSTGRTIASRVSSVPDVQLYVTETVVEGEPCAFTARR
jgi:hypothetical protein